MEESYVVHIVKECNANCVYCYEKDKTSIYTWDEIKTVLDSIHANNKDSYSIEFLGGEPCLRFDLIKQSCEYLTEVGANVSQFTITTNGTLLTDDMLDYLKEHSNIHYAVSVDGTKSMNSLRVFKDGINTYDICIANLRKALKVLGSDQVAVHMVTHPYNIGALAEGIRHLYEDVGVTLIGVGSIESEIKIGYEYCMRYLTEMDIVSKWLITNNITDLYLDNLHSDYSNRLTDRRHYIYDDNGKIVAETYGRAKDDIISTDEFTAVDVSVGDTQEITDSDIILSLRIHAYNKHQENLTNLGS